MNFEESNSFMQAEEKKERKKKAVIFGILICIVLIALIATLIGVIKYQDYKTFKMFINGQQYFPSSTLFANVDGVTYIDVKEMGDTLGYNYKQGEYNQYNEVEESCYITNDFEIITFTAEEKHFIKYARASGTGGKVGNIQTTVKSEEGQAQKYALDKEIKLIDGKIYVPFEAALDIYNVQLNLSQENRIFVYTLDAVVANTQNVISRAGYKKLSVDYENLKAILYGYAIVGNGEDFGVMDLKTKKEMLSVKYEDITFVPNAKDFFVETSNGVGLFSSEGVQIIEPSEYDDISIYDDENQLYLVEKNGKYGIVNELGKIIIHTDYDKIGYSFKTNNETIEYKIIFDKCIPVKENNKYGLYAIDGTDLTGCVYDTLGSAKTKDSGSNENPILEIPQELGIKGIVISQNGMYGIYDITEEQIIIPCSCTKAYSITRSAQTTYFLEHAGEQINLDDYLTGLNLKNLDENGNPLK